MSTPMEKIVNGSGGKVLIRGQLRRMSRAVIEIRGVQIVAEYFPEGCFMPATATDPAEYPCCDLRKVEIGHVDVTRLIEDSELWDEITLAIEREWREEV
jgi:hypothetical protein